MNIIFITTSWFTKKMRNFRKISTAHCHFFRNLNVTHYIVDNVLNITITIVVSLYLSFNCWVLNYERRNLLLFLHAYLIFFNKNSYVPKIIQFTNLYLRCNIFFIFSIFPKDIIHLIEINVTIKKYGKIFEIEKETSIFSLSGV